MKIKNIYYTSYGLQALMAINIIVAGVFLPLASSLLVQCMYAFAIGLSTWTILRCWNHRRCIRILRQYFEERGQDYWNT